METDISFVLQVVAGCDVTEFVDWALPSTSSYTINVLDDAITVPIGPVDDTVSRKNGNQDGVSYCGARKFRIIDPTQVQSFITLDQDLQTLSIKPTLDEEIGR